MLVSSSLAVVWRLGGAFGYPGAALVCSFNFSLYLCCFTYVIILFILLNKSHYYMPNVYSVLSCLLHGGGVL